MDSSTSSLSQAVAWITGAGGLIGNSFVRTTAAEVPAWQPRGLTRQIVDLTDFVAVRRLFAAERPALVIHCAALSQSPACQANPALARSLNVDVTKFLAELAVEITFVFFSSDLVFDGRKGGYVETDTPNPLSVYAETKVAAEHFVREHPRHLIVRTSLNGGTSPTGDRGFNEQMRRVWQQGRALRLFTDEFRSPIAAQETTRAVWRLIANEATGTYHVTGGERLSRWRIGELLAARWPQIHPRIEPASLKEYQGAPRPPDTSLDCTKAEKLLGTPLPRFSDWLLAHPNEPF